MLERTCSQCNETKVITDFYKAQGNRDGYNKRCRSCVKDYPSQTPARMLERIYNIRTRNRQYAWEYLLKHPCLDCGEVDPVVLEFDHVRGEKKAEVGRLIHHTSSLKALQAEIDKCEVVCSNCHRRRTAKTQEWDKAISFRFLSGD